MRYKNYILIYLLSSICVCSAANNDKRGIECFTHPLIACDIPISVYTAPYVYEKQMSRDRSEEAGWIVYAEEVYKDFIKIRFENDSVRWVHIGDVGVVVQNYFDFGIPVYMRPNNTAPKITYIYESQMALLTNFTDKYACVVLVGIEDAIYGWVERKYLCGSPYTTCPDIGN